MCGFALLLNKCFSLVPTPSNPMHTASAECKSLPVDLGFGHVAYFGQLFISRSDLSKGWEHAHRVKLSLLGFSYYHENVPQTAFKKMRNTQQRATLVNPKTHSMK